MGGLIWEEIGEYTVLAGDAAGKMRVRQGSGGRISRARVPGGWFVRDKNATFFYPDPTHQWSVLTAADLQIKGITVVHGNAGTTAQGLEYFEELRQRNFLKAHDGPYEEEGGQKVLEPVKKG